jgi:hypothetical protein
MPQHAGISVRKLPGGDLHAAVSIAAQGRLCTIEFGEGGAPPELTPGSLLEITSAQTMYLGEVLAREHRRIEAQVEHAVDRARVAALQASWDQVDSAR